MSRLTLKTAREMYKSDIPSIKQFALDNFCKESLEQKELPKTWDKLKYVEGYYVKEKSYAQHTTKVLTLNDNKNVFKTKEQTEASIALAQLSQLIHVYNNGWLPNWSNDTVKFVVKIRSNNITLDTSYYYNYFLTFKSKEIRETFLDNFQDLVIQAIPLL